MPAYIIVNLEITDPDDRGGRRGTDPDNLKPEQP